MHACGVNSACELGKVLLGDAEGTLLATQKQFCVALGHEEQPEAAVAERQESVLGRRLLEHRGEHLNHTCVPRCKLLLRRTRGHRGHEEAHARQQRRGEDAERDLEVVQLGQQAHLQHRLRQLLCHEVADVVCGALGHA
jgi:hypothetical protein